MAIVSIIVPVYNAEKYLMNCLDSVMNQTFLDFELLLINDGSTDKSGEICDEYAQKDERVKVFHKENGGVSSARNLGLEKAQGEWITFVDSDDYITENYFGVLENRNIGDLVLLNVDRFNDSETYSILLFDNFNVNINEFLSGYTLYPDFSGPWGKFYKRCIIEENNIRFNDKVHFGEDALFNIQFVSYAKEVSSFNNTKYMYRDTENGLSKVRMNFNDDQFFFNSIRNILMSYDKKNYIRNIAYPMNRFLLSVYCSKQHSQNEKQELLTKLIDKEFDAIMYLYRKSAIRYLIKISHKVGVYYFLHVYLNKRISC